MRQSTRYRGEVGCDWIGPTSAVHPAGLNLDPPVTSSQGRVNAPGLPVYRPVVLRTDNLLAQAVSNLELSSSS